MNAGRTILAAVLFLLAGSGYAVQSAPAVQAPVDDAAIVAAVKSQLDASSVLYGYRSTVYVDITGGTVLLRGLIADNSARLWAEQLAWQAAGVKHVVNNLAAQTDDEFLAIFAIDALQREDARDIAVEVRHGVVHLNGVVPRAENRIRAESRVKQIPGVGYVINDLQVAEP